MTRVLLTHRSPKERRKPCAGNTHQMRHIRVARQKSSGRLADEYHCDACGVVMWREKK